MLALSKKTEYAIIALTYLAEHRGTTASARQIATAYALPQALLMNILKRLHSRGLLNSTRGIHGGYRLAVEPAELKLIDIIECVDGPVRLTECADSTDGMSQCRIGPKCPIRKPVRELHNRLREFLSEVTLTTLAAETNGSSSCCRTEALAH